MVFTRTERGAPAGDGTFGPSTITAIVGEGILVRGDPQEYEAAGLSRIVGPTVLFMPESYTLKAYTAEFVLPGDVAVVNGASMTVKKVLYVVAPDGVVIISRIALGA